MKKSKEQENIQHKRELIDAIDSKIITLLNERFSICAQIAHYKKESSTPIKQEKREQEIFQDREEKALKLGIKPNFTKALFKLIIQQSRTIQKEQEDL